MLHRLQCGFRELLPRNSVGLILQLDDGYVKQQQMWLMCRESYTAILVQIDVGMMDATNALKACNGA